MTILLKGV